MASHQVESSIGSRFEIVVGDDTQIHDVVGDWPEAGVEFQLHGPIPEHSPIKDVPVKISATADERGQDVCFYDPDGCRTCFCDDRGHMHCVGEC